MGERSQNRKKIQLNSLLPFSLKKTCFGMGYERERLHGTYLGDFRLTDPRRQGKKDRIYVEVNKLKV